jgi:hypothetical protein
MRYWAAELDRETLEAEVNTMLKVALDILASKRSKLVDRFEENDDTQDDGQQVLCW